MKCVWIAWMQIVSDVNIATRLFVPAVTTSTNDKYSATTLIPNASVFVQCNYLSGPEPAAESRRRDNPESVKTTLNIPVLPSNVCSGSAWHRIYRMVLNNYVLLYAVASGNDIDVSSGLIAVELNAHLSCWWSIFEHRFESSIWRPMSTYSAVHECVGDDVAQVTFSAGAIFLLKFVNRLPVPFASRIRWLVSIHSSFSDESKLTDVSLIEDESLLAQSQCTSNTTKAHSFILIRVNNIHVNNIPSMNHKTVSIHRLNTYYWILDIISEATHLIANKIGKIIIFLFIQSVIIYEKTILVFYLIKYSDFSDRIISCFWCVCHVKIVKRPYFPVVITLTDAKYSASTSTSNGPTLQKSFSTIRR